MGIYRRTLVYYRPFLGVTLGALALGLVVTALNLLKPWPFKYIVDGLLSPDSSAAAPTREQLQHWFGTMPNATVLLILCASMVVITLLAGVINLASNYLLIGVGLRALLRIRTDLYAYLQSLSLKFHDERRSSDSSFRVAYDSQAIQTIYNRGFINIFNSAVMLGATFFVMVKIDALLTFLSLAVVPLIVFTIHYYAKRIRSQSTTIQERESDLLATVQEGLSSVRMVHAFGQEDREVGQFRARAAESLRANLKLTFTNVTSAQVDPRRPPRFCLIPSHALRAARTADLHRMGHGRRGGGSQAVLRYSRSRGRCARCARCESDRPCARSHSSEKRRLRLR
jgi:ATP-binding cassette subfamily B protein/subfamily B ATP-binding cassette protein MsbA